MGATESAFSAILRFCFPASERPGLMLMLAAYFDDSGTHDDSSVVVWGGFLGTATQWSNFDKVWRAKLAAPLPGKPCLKKFSLADCNGSHGEFSGYSRAESDLVQNEFREIIIQAEVVGLAYAIDRADWDKFVQGSAREFFGDAEVGSFSGCFNGVIAEAERLFPEDRMLSLHFDRGRKSPKLDALIDKGTKNYRGSPAIVNLSFNRVVDFTPLQAADILATENYWQATSIVAGAHVLRPHFSHFLSRLKAANGYLATEHEIKDTLRRYGY
jgi:hypothetical protein